MNEQEFWAILTAPPPEAPPIIYRLYYDDLGNPLFFSMADLPGNYIDIDHDTFQKSPPNIKVVDGKLIILETSVVNKLKPGDSGVCCDPRDVCVVVDESRPHIKWSLK
jgi:hypothetical protein